MEKYVRIKKDDQFEEDIGLSALYPTKHVRINAHSYVEKYIAFVVSQLEKEPTILLKGRGSAITNLVTTTEILRRRQGIPPLHQISHIGVLEVEDEYEPLEEGLDIITHTRTIPYMQIVLSKNELDTSHYAYQAPITKREPNKKSPVAKGRTRTSPSNGSSEQYAGYKSFNGGSHQFQYQRGKDSGKGYGKHQPFQYVNQTFPMQMYQNRFVPLRPNIMRGPHMIAQQHWNCDAYPRGPFAQPARFAYSQFSKDRKFAYSQVSKNRTMKFGNRNNLKGNWIERKVKSDQGTWNRIQKPAISEILP